MEFRVVDPWVFGYGCGLFVLAAYAYAVGVSDGFRQAEQWRRENQGDEVPPARWWSR